MFVLCFPAWIGGVKVCGCLGEGGFEPVGIVRHELI